MTKYVPKGHRTTQRADDALSSALRNFENRQWSWDEHCNRIYSAIKELDRKDAESRAASYRIAVTN